MRVLAQIPRRIFGRSVPFFYKTIELEVSDDGIVTTNPVLQKGEQVSIDLEYRGEHDNDKEANSKR